MYYQPPSLPVELTMMLATMHRDDAERVVAAFRFAAAAHSGQVRDEGSPFIDHPVAVADILWRELGCRDVDMIVSALNHDVLEDTEVEPAALESAFGERSFDLVQTLTKVKVPD